MTDLNHWDNAIEFTAREAAALIAGVDPADPGAPLHKSTPAFRLLEEGHRVARARLTTAPSADQFRLWRARWLWADSLMSVLFDLYPLLYQEAWPGDPDRPFVVGRRFAGPDGDFEKQKFARAEIHRWLCAMRMQSKYEFMRVATPAESTPPAEAPRIDNTMSATVGTATVVAAGTREKPAKPMPRSTSQDATILAAIREAGHDPKALPVNAAGKRGVKATIRAALVGVNPLFLESSTTFDKAWDRLRKNGEIADQH